MSLIQYWWTGITQPAAAFGQLEVKTSPHWAFWCVLIINVVVSLTTTTSQVLLGRAPQLESVLTFLPTERYLQAEIFFLPVLRIGIWLLQAAIIHLGIRLAGQVSDMDRILMIGGLIYLIVMPPLMVTDWVLVGLDRFEVGITMYTHGLAALWSVILTILGLRVLLGIKLPLGVLTSTVALISTLPLLMIFAR
jgi:hypothetical protein